MSLQQVIAILWARKWIAILTLAAAVAAASALIILLPPRYEASTSVMLDIAEPDPVTGQMMPSPLIRTQQRSQMAVLQSDRVALDVVDRLNLTRDPQYQQDFREATEGRGGDLARWIADQLRENLRAGFVDGSTVMQITYTATSPQVAAVLANTFKAAYLAANLDVKVEPARRNAQWFATQIDALRADLQKARDRLNAFQEENQLLVQGENGDIEGTKLAALNERLMAARAQLTAARNSVAPGAGDGSGGGTSGASSVAALKSQLAAVEAEATRLSSQLGPRNPALREVYAKRQALLRLIDEAEQDTQSQQSARVEALRQQVSDLEQEIADQRQFMLDQQGGQDELNRLTREVAFRQQQLDEAEARAASYRMQGQQSFVNAVSLDEAAPPATPAFPQKPLILALAIGLGLAGGLILSLLVEMLDRRVRTDADLADAVGVEPLGVLASARTPRRLLRGGHRGGLPAPT